MLFFELNKNRLRNAGEYNGLEFKNMITTWHPGIVFMSMAVPLIIILVLLLFPPERLKKKLGYPIVGLCTLLSIGAICLLVSRIRVVNIAALNGSHAAWHKNDSGSYELLPPSLWLTSTFNREVVTGEIWERTTPTDSEVTAYSPSGRFTISYALPLPDNEIRIIKNLGITNRWDLSRAVDNVLLQAFGRHSTNVAELASDPLLDGIQILHVTLQDPVPKKVVSR